MKYTGQSREVEHGSSRTPHTQSSSGTCHSTSAGATDKERQEACCPTPPTDESRVAYTGWRIWRISKGKLCSLNTADEWHPGTAMVAKVAAAHAILQITLSLNIFVATVGTLVLLSGLMESGIGFPALIFTLAMLLILALMDLPRLLCMLRAYLYGERVQPGTNTPGIYAFKEYTQASTFITSPMIIQRGYIRVMGTVDLWGDTIEHTNGVKGEFAYPNQLTNVACDKCGRWLPLEEYLDDSMPPLCPPGLDTSFYHHRMVTVLLSSVRWKTAGINALRETAPEWFKEQV